MVDLIAFTGTLLIRATATNFAKACFCSRSTSSSHSTLGSSVTGPGSCASRGNE